MKKYTALLILVITTHLVVAQKQYIPNEDDWFFYDLSYASYLNAPPGVEMEGFPNGHSFSLFREKLFGASKLSFAYGLGFTSDNFRSNLGIAVDPASGDAQFSVIPDSVGYDANKLTIQYFEIPLELRFRGKPNDKGNFFRWYVGGRVGVRFNAYSKFKDEQINLRYYHPDELSRFKAGVYTRIGFSNFSLYGYYGLTDLFDYSFDPATNGLDLNGMKQLNVGASFSF